MAHNVVLTTTPARRTAVVKTQTTWQEFPGRWKPMLDQVWACLNTYGITCGCRNVMLYLDDTPRVEVGVELTTPCPLSGEVVLSTLPAGPGRDDRPPWPVHRPGRRTRGRRDVVLAAATPARGAALGGLRASPR
ncbi:AraC family transcriptional regulator [Dactylosporangium sp. NPDC050588]|uniref:AraC family transcriptional regulator n=1 Tax=Dactylosporangium sp. NPDC050588 TaxID=3157211 RepID=UPI003401C648